MIEEAPDPGPRRGDPGIGAEKWTFSSRKENPMNPKSLRWILPVAVLALMAAAVRSDDGPGGAAPGGTIRMEARTGDDGQVRVFVNGREVQPEAAAEPERGEAFLGVGIEPAENGARVTYVFPGSPAAKAELQAGDVITALGRRRIPGPEALVSAIAERKPGDRVTISYERRGEARSVSLELAAASRERPFLEPGPPPFRFEPRGERGEGEQKGEEKGEGEEAAPEAFLGVVAAAMPEGMQEIAGTDKGVLINTLIDGSPAAKADLMPGDVVTAVDGQEVDTPEAFVKIIRGHKPGDKVALTFYRMGKRRTATVALGKRTSQAEEGFRLRELPRDLYRDMPDFRGYWDRIQPELRDYLDRWRDWAERERERIAPKRPEEAPEAPPAEGPGSYGVGKDVGRILERLDRIQRQLDDMDRRLDDMDKRLDRLERR